LKGLPWLLLARTEENFRIADNMTNISYIYIYIYIPPKYRLCVIFFSFEFDFVAVGSVIFLLLLIIIIAITPFGMHNEMAPFLIVDEHFKIAYTSCGPVEG
jgi:hypothetical protein